MQNHQTKVCKFFLIGKCTYKNCKYKHVQSDTLGASAPLAAAGGIDSNSQSALPVTAGPLNPETRSSNPVENLSADDVVSIRCSLRLSPDCAENVRASPAYWTVIKDDRGRPYSVPKSCKACRSAKKLTAAASLLVAEDIRLKQLAALMATTHDDEFENADDDYAA